ncbi:MFS transporter [Streptomyces griseocarneus]|uniref:MFS transporter n=1 Tax=Streptomyces griseocarneus TaxID=51201 RepID=UPI00167EBB9F|nr:MFS transporter [Streptomyces griseocarneus]MBZ6474406.1 MFS transporter [Streptomyces griseocarneus]GHG68448.1 putative MFS-type transporter YdeG [Streptomyces griseocarneus]
MSAGTSEVPGAAVDFAHDEPPEQRRILTVLVLAQLLSGAGLAAGITVGALLGEEMLGSTGLAGVPSALFTAGAAVGAVGVGRLCQRRGRRPGLAVGYATGAVGSLGVVAAAALDDVPLLFLSLLVYGAGTATNLLARYAGVDVAAPARRGRAAGLVLFATTLGAVIGPTLVTVTGDVAHGWGIPRLAGPFLLAAGAFAAATVILGVFLRPDPLHLARERAARAAAPRATDEPEAAPAGRGHARGVATGTAVMILSQLAMIAIMTMTPVHMRAHGHDTQAAGLVIALHVGAMFLPSPLTGYLVDRLGRVRVALASGVTLLAAGLLAALAPPHSAAALAVALVLLGLGWNLGFVSGTAIVADSVPLATRASTQGLVDVGISLAGATGGMASGLVVAHGGFPVLAVGGGVLALAIVPVLALTGRPSHPLGGSHKRPPGRPGRSHRM